MANITITEAADFIPEIVAAEALGYLTANLVMAPLVNRNYESDVAQYGDTVHVPKRGTLVVNLKTANNATTKQTPSGDKVSVVLNRHAEVTFLLEDPARAMSRPDILSGYVSDGLQVHAEAIDSYLLGLYSGFSTTPIDATTGSGGVVAGTVTEARRIMNNNRVPNMGRHIVWHPDAEAELLQVEKFTSSDFGDDGSAVREANIGRKYGFNHFMSQLVPTAVGEAKNLAFHRDAIVFVTRPLPAPEAGMGVRATAMTENGVGLRVLMGYSLDHLAYQITIDILYGAAELRDEFGVVIESTEVV